MKRSEAIAKVLEHEMSAKSPWQPTLKLAGDAANILITNNVPVIVAAKPSTLSSDTSLAINAWFNNDKTTTKYTRISARAIALRLGNIAGQLGF
ncbi:MAG: hypothetical protein IPN42_06840 [Methylococcaceae bacterium]|nr:hypothetical protein [Methylococcaceae bacterium]